MHVHIDIDNHDVVVPSEPTSGDSAGVEHADELPRQATQLPVAEFNGSPDTLITLVAGGCRSDEIEILIVVW